MRVHLRIATVAALALGVGLGACSAKGDDGAGPFGGIGSLHFAAQLKSAGSCDSLLDHLRNEAAPGRALRTQRWRRPHRDVRRDGFGLGGAPSPSAGGPSPSGPTRTQPRLQPRPTRATPRRTCKRSASTSRTWSRPTGRGSWSSPTASSTSSTLAPEGRDTPSLVGTIDLGDDNFQPTEILVSGNRVLVFGTRPIGFRKGLIAPNARVAGGIAEDIAPDSIAPVVDDHGSSISRYRPHRAWSSVSKSKATT